MIYRWFELYGQSRLSHAVAQSTWAFAAIEVVHLLALATLGGGIVVGALGWANVAFGIAQPLEIWRGAKPYILWSFAIVIASGVVLVASNPLKYYFHDAFRVKMAVLLLLGISLGTINWLNGSSGQAENPGRRVLVALLAVAAWLAVALAGRLIGLL